MAQKNQTNKVTGLYTKESFLAHLNEFLSGKQEDIENRVLIYCNIRNFSYYNIQNGRNAGDQVLRDLANLILKENPGQLCAHYDSDHFAFVAMQEDVNDLIVKIFDAFSEKYQHTGLKVKAGIYNLRKGVSASASSKQAQIACHSIRDAQLDYCYFNERLNKRTAAKAYVLSNIDQALEKEWIQVYYQPVVRTITGRLCGLEALTRWIDPKKGMISPVEFIPVLEENHLITKLDLYMLDHVCQTMSERMSHNERVVPISINLSREDFLSCDIFEEVEKRVQTYHIARDYLNIEVTESIVMEDPETLKKEMARFRQAGYEIWMDDFGSGYSSLNVLRDFVFDEIKLDMLFMRNFDERAKQMIRSIISMAKQLKLQTLAEGVETKEQFDFLRAIGCEKVQGYYYSPPVTLDKILEMFDRSEAVETRLDKAFYRSVGSFDFMSSQSLGIEDYYDGEFHLLYRNDKYHEVWKKLGVINDERRYDLINSPHSPYYEEFRKLLDKLNVTDDFIPYDFEIYGKMVSLNINLLAKQGDHLLIALQVLGDIKQDQDDNGAGYVRHLLPSIYDGIYILNMKNGQVQTVKPGVNHDLLTAIWKGDLVADVERLAELVIQNEDRAEFIRFANLATIRERLAREHRDYLTQMFRTRMDNGSFIWKLHTLQIAPGSDYVIYSTLDVPFLQAQLTEKSEELSLGENENVFAKAIWNTVLHSLTFNVFWKDENRRFVGVNDAFLKSYNLNDAHEVIGKTDEDMGWNIDEGSFRDDEYQVIHDGVPIVNEIGKSIISGQSHNILINKSPVYYHGKRIGLVGSFMSLDNLTSSLGGNSINDKQDPVTHLMTAQAISNVASDYMEGWTFRKEKFAAISVEFDSYQRALHTYNQSIARKMLRDLGMIIEEACRNFAVAGRIFGEYFLILVRYEHKEEVQKINARFLERCLNTHELAGYQETVNPSIKIYYVEDTDDPRTMMMEATHGFDIGFGTTKNFEEHLRENNIDLEELIRHIPGGVALFTVEDCIYPVYVSKTLTQVFGYSEKEYLKLVSEKNCFGAYEEDSEMVRTKVRSAVESGKSYQVAYRAQRKDGKIIWIYEQGSQIGTRNGRPLLLSVFQNLSNAGQVFNYIMGETQEGLIVRECRTHHIMYYNQAITSLLESVEPHASVEALSETLLKGHSDGDVFDLRYASRYLKVRIRKTDWYGRDSELCYLVDYTMQHKKVLSLQEILSHVPAGIALYEVDQNNEVKCTYLSEQARKHCHIAYTDMDSFEALMSVVHPEEREMAAKSIGHAIVSRQPLDIELRVIDFDGKVYWDRLELESHVQDDGHYYIYGVFTDITEVHKRREQLEVLSQSDELTGLRNRYALRYDFDLFVQQNLTVMMLDVDHFKAFNDHFGHEIGDKVMKACGQAVREEFGNCYCYRYGGDEIMIISLSDDYDLMQVRFDQMMQTLEEICAERSIPSVIFSCGIAHGYCENGEAVRECFRRADRLVYINKAEHHAAEKELRNEDGA